MQIHTDSSLWYIETLTNKDIRLQLIEFYYAAIDGKNLD